MGSVVIFKVFKTHQMIRKIHFTPHLPEGPTLIWISPEIYSLFFFNLFKFAFSILVKHFARDIIFLLLTLKKESSNWKPALSKYLNVYILYFNLLKDWYFFLVYRVMRPH